MGRLNLQNTYIMDAGLTITNSSTYINEEDIVSEIRRNKLNSQTETAIMEKIKAIDQLPNDIRYMEIVTEFKKSKVDNILKVFVNWITREDMRFTSIDFVDMSTGETILKVSSNKEFNLELLAYYKRKDLVRYMVRVQDGRTYGTICVLIRDGIEGVEVTNEPNELILRYNRNIAGVTSGPRSGVLNGVKECINYMYSKYEPESSNRLPFHLY